ncbi:hypothetical protein WMY93_034405, partial [Mugilogobius chulae]
MSHWEEAKGKTQDTLEGLCLSTVLGTPRDPPRRAGGGVYGQGSLGVLAQTAAPATRPRIKRKKMDGWASVVVLTKRRARSQRDKEARWECKERVKDQDEAWSAGAPSGEAVASGADRRAL